MKPKVDRPDSNNSVREILGKLGAGDLDRLVSAKEMSRITGKSLPTLWRWRRKGLMPPCVHMPSGGIAWRASDVAAWIATLVERGMNSSMVSREDS